MDISGHVRLLGKNGQKRSHEACHAKGNLPANVSIFLV